MQGRLGFTDDAFSALYIFLGKMSLEENSVDRNHLISVCIFYVDFYLKGGNEEMKEENTVQVCGTERIYLGKTGPYCPVKYTTMIIKEVGMVIRRCVDVSS